LNVDKAYELRFDASFDPDVKNKEVSIELTYGTTNSRKGSFQFDVSDLSAKDQYGHADSLFCADVPKEKLVDFAQWVLAVADAEKQVATPVNSYVITHSNVNIT